MLKKTLTFTDYNGEERTMEFYFHLTEAEIAETELKTGGFSARLTSIMAEQDGASLVKTFRELIASTVGKRTDDGLRFVKNADIRSEFMDSPAYSALFMELIQDPTKAAEFIRGVVPTEIGNKISDREIKELVDKRVNKPLVDCDQPYRQEFTDNELAEMPTEEFNRRFGTDPLAWPTNVLLAAFKKKNTA